MNKKSEQKQNNKKKTRYSHKALRKNLVMEIKNTFSRFLSLLIIVALGVAFYTGVRSTEPDMLISLDKLYDDSKYMDIAVMAPDGITQDNIDEINKLDSVEIATGVKYIDAVDNGNVDSNVVRIYSLNDEINKISIVNGRLPCDSKECVVDKAYLKKMNYKIGDSIKIEIPGEIPAEYFIKQTEYTITGTFTSPMYLQGDRGTCNIENGKIGGAAYVFLDNFCQDKFNAVYVISKNAINYRCFTDEYDGLVSETTEEIQKINKNYIVLDRNYASLNYAEFEMDAERVGKIGKIVPIIFFIVAALVSLTTMTRMVEEQRTQIGTLKALGYSKTWIAMKYMMYGFMATIGGSVIGAVIGSKVLPRVIINAYKIMYTDLTVIKTPVNKEHFFVAVIFAIVCVNGATLFACYKSLCASAANLMRPEAPKEGKRIFLEKIPLIWKHLNFTWKSTVRNLMRYKKRMFMTIFGISGCMALLLTGFGIKNSISSIVTKQYEELHKYNEVLNYETNISEEAYDNVSKILTEDSRIESFINMYEVSADFEYKDKKLNGYIYVPEDEKDISRYIVFRSSDNDKKYKLKDNTVIITEKMSKLLGISKGDILEIKGENGKSYQIKVAEVTENYVYHYVYMNKSTYKELYGNDVIYNQILLNLKSKYQNKDLSKDLLSIDGISSTNSIDTLRNKFSDMISGLDIIILVIVIAAGGLAFVVLYNLNTVNISERIRELATLKVLGFYDGEVSSYVFRENILLSVIGIICGYIGGIILHHYVITTVEVDLVMFGRDIYLSSFIYSTLITIIFSIIINGIMHFKLKNIDMATSLKSIE